MPPRSQAGDGGRMIGDRIVLASASPRRRELATQLGVRFDVVPADIDESPLADETATAYVERLAREKASAAAGLCGGTAQSDPGIPPRLVLAADTTVELDGAIFGKPADAADAARMLRLLSGRVHHVHTGVAVAVAVRPVAVRPVGDPPVRELRHDVHSLVVTTEVVLDDLAESDVAFYVATGEPLDKAGAYAIQGLGGAYVTAVRGSVSNVIGLPLVETRRLLREVGHRLGGR